MHNWIGGKIKYSEEGLNYWWSEGFTEYYCRKLHLNSKGLAMQDYINEANRILKDYYLSSVINEPNERIKEDF